MPIIGNPIILGGGGGIDFSQAIIHVVAPTGSSLTFSLGGSTIGTLSSNDSVSDGGDSNYSDYFFSVDSSNYGTITITANPLLNAKTVSVSAVKLYTVYLATQFDLYNSGTFSPAYTYSTETTRVSISYGSSRITMSGSKSGIQSGYIIWDAVDLTSFDYIYLYRSAPSDNYSRWTGLFITQDPTVRTALNASIVQHYSTNPDSSITTLDISSYSGHWYVGAGYDSNGSSYSSARTEYINRVLLA